MQVLPDDGTSSIAVTEERVFFSRNCPIWQHNFTHGQYIAKYRCGHAVCTDCFDILIHRGWNSCRKSSTTRRARVNDEDLGVFIRQH
jgi:hypothetical protein